MKIKLKLFKLANKLFEHYHFIYKPLYFFYKKISDRQKIALFKNIIKPGMRVLDLGANIGFYTVLFSKLVGENGKVFAFEPDAKNYKYLEENTKTLYNVTIEKKAVSDKTGKINFYISKDLNVDHQSYDSREGRDCEEADAIALDDYFLDNAKIDVIKIIKIILIFMAGKIIRSGINIFFRSVKKSTTKTQMKKILKKRSNRAIKD